MVPAMPVARAYGAQAGRGRTARCPADWPPGPASPGSARRNARRESARPARMTRQFMGGSEDRPVSKAWMCGVRSPKHSSMVSNPENAPNTEKWGVQIWAGMSSASGQASSVSSSRSRLSRPRMGRPSEWMFPTASRRAASSSAASRDGQQDQVVDLARPAAALVNRADLSGDDKARRARRARVRAGAALRAGYTGPPPRGQAAPCSSARQAGWVKSPGAHQRDPLAAWPTSPGAARRSPGWWPGKNGSVYAGRQCTCRGPPLQISVPIIARLPRRRNAFPAPGRKARGPARAVRRTAA